MTDAPDLPEVSPEEGAAFLNAMTLAGINGLFSVLIMMARRGMITEQELAAMHNAMSDPFALPPVAENALVQRGQRYVDDSFANVKRFLRDGPLPPQGDVMPKADG